MCAHVLQAHQQQRKVAIQHKRGTAPRFERLMARLNLTEKEQLVMLYVLVKQVSQEDFANLFSKYGRSSPSLAAFADLVSPVMLHCCTRRLPACMIRLGQSQTLRQIYWAYIMPIQCLPVALSRQLGASAILAAPQLCNV